jgi:hypothetical protein
MDWFAENCLLNENHENSKHQKPNFKQIPMTQIQNSIPELRLQNTSNGIIIGRAEFAKR